MNRRKGLVLIMAGVSVACWYLVRFDGDPKPVDAVLVAPIQEAPAWGPPPTLLQNINEPAAIYLATGLPGSDGQFEALRLDVNNGARSPARIRFGPNTAYIPFDSAENAGIPAMEFRGLTIGRPTPHLLGFPGPGGPGFHVVDSATGVMHIAAGKGDGRRTLLTLTLINSSSVPEMRSHLWSDQARRWAAFFWRKGDVWTLYLFSLIPAKPSFSLDVLQGGWWSDCNDPAVEFLISGSHYSGDFAGTYTLTLNGDILIFTDGLIDGHSINVTHKPLSFQILAATDKELVLRPLPGNPYVGDWRLQSCKCSSARPSSSC